MAERRPQFRAEPVYYEYVAHGYDLIADSYDEVEARNFIGRRMREKVQDVLLRTFQPGSRVIEIGCGTGIEALALASNGVRVLATDLSEEMVQRVRSKTEALGVDNITVHSMAAHEVGRLEEEFGRSSFDGAYSHAGALNMDPRLSDVAAGLSRILRPSGHFVCTVVNQTSLFEALFYPLFLRPRKGYRRLGNVIPTPITRLDAFKHYVVPVRSYSPGAFLRHFSRDFELRHLEGLQILLPPWNLSHYLERLEPLARILVALEDRLSKLAPFNRWGNVFLMDLVRSEV